MKNEFKLDIVNKEIIKKFINTNDSLLITGKVWTGKTELMKLLLELSPKKSIQLAANDKQAIKSGTVSVQSFLNFSEKEYSLEYISFIKELELIAIDEVSFLSSLMLDKLDLALKKIRKNSNPLGGIQLILVGDLCETHNFLDDTEIKKIKEQYKSEYFFDSRCFNSLNIEYFDLGGIYNKEMHFDTENLYFLLGNNNIESGYLDFLNRIFVYDSNKENDKLILTVDNQSAYIINNDKLEEIQESQQYTFQCDVLGDFDLNMAPVEPIINLKKGAKVILIKNQSANSSYENGALGIFDGIENNEVQVIVNGLRVSISKTDWVNYEYDIDKVNNTFTKTQKGVFSQYPIKLGWAISLRDCKGMVFKNFHFENKDLQVLENSQVYSLYCKTLGSGKYSVSIPFRRSDITSDEKVIDFLFKNVYKHKVFEESDAEY